MMEKGETIETLILPEDVIHCIQSFMTGEEAARTAILSKSWHSAWLTRPTIDLDDRGFRPGGLAFQRFARKTMWRYRDLSLKIKRFRFSCHHIYNGCEDISSELIACALKLRATDVELELDRQPYASSSYLLKQVLGSESLLNLSVIRCRLVENNYAIRCSRLKSLNLKYVRASNDRFNDIISCLVSLEELSLSNSIVNPKLFVLPNLKRMLLDYVNADDNTFFTDFASRYPCLKELTILNGWYEWRRIHIASNSLETITFKPYKDYSYKATFDVPNIRKFIVYSGFGLPSLSINGGSREWEFDITIACNRLYNNSWFLNLKRLLTECRLSKITSLIINVDDTRRLSLKHEFGFKVEAEPLVVENLRIDAPTSIFDILLLRLLGICRPKFITHYWLGDKCESLDVLCKTLMHGLITPNCGIPNQYVFGQFGLEKVNLEVYEMVGTEWRRLPLKEPLDAFKATVERRMIRFEMTWD